jgi:3-oxoacyl-[acyl-carrier-protein] synthase-3
LPLQYCHETYAEHLDLCKVDGGGHRLPVFDYVEQRREEYLFDMDGPQLFRVALRHLLPMVERLIDRWEQSAPGLDRKRLHFIPHQASPKALELVRRGLRVPADRFHTAVDQVGNMAAASIPWMIHRLLSSGVCQRGDHAVLLGTSAGYAQAAMILQL